jgi:hypothetical protein
MIRVSRSSTRGTSWWAIEEVGPGKEAVGTWLSFPEGDDLGGERKRIDPSGWRDGPQPSSIPRGDTEDHERRWERRSLASSR